MRAYLADRVTRGTRTGAGVLPSRHLKLLSDSESGRRREFRLRADTTSEAPGRQVGL